MTNTTMILVRRIKYLEGENQYLKELLQKWLKIFSLIEEKENNNA